MFFVRKFQPDNPPMSFMPQNVTRTYLPLSDDSLIILPWIHRKVRAIASWVLERELKAERPLVILSDNSIDHALLALGAMYVGVPVAAISPAYSLMSSDHQKLCAMIKLLKPGAIYASDIKAFGPALAAIEGLHEAIVVTSGAAAASPIARDSVQ